MNSSVKMLNLTRDDRSEVESKLTLMAKEGIISPEIKEEKERIWKVRLYSWINGDGLADFINEFGLEYLGQIETKTYPLIVNVAAQSRIHVLKFQPPDYKNGLG